jgi:glycosyltransferase involved in cell wall biosynthesis
MELNPDIVQTWMYHADLIGGFAAYSSGIKNVIWNVRSSDITKGGSRQTLFVRRICAMISRIIPQKIVFVGRRSQILHCDLGYDESRSTVITNGFSLTLLNVLPIKTAAFRSQLRLTDDNLLVGFVGRAEFIKGPDIFIKAMAPLFAQFSNLIVLMVGRGMTTENQDLVRWLGETGYPERFRILGQRNDVPVCLSAMDVFCLSSRSEGFPNALGEAMLMGLPCVTTDVGDARFLVGTSGIVVPNEDVAKLSIAIDKLLSLKPQERTLLGKDSQNRIKDRFSLERFLMNFEAIYDEVLTPMKVR